MQHPEKSSHPFVVSPNAVLQVNAKQRRYRQHYKIQSDYDRNNMKSRAILVVLQYQKNICAKNYLNHDTKRDFLHYDEWEKSFAIKDQRYENYGKNSNFDRPKQNIFKSFLKHKK